MARLATLTLLLVATAAHAAGQCDEAREMAGLVVTVRDGALVVSEVVPDGAAARSDVRVGDVVLQVNDRVPLTCGEWARAVDHARDERKALLLLVGRDEAEVALALGRRTWGPEAPDAPPIVAGRPTPPPVRRPAVVEAPPPFPADVPVSADSVLTDLGALLGKSRTGLAAYREAVTSARRGVETLAARKAAPPESIAALRRVARLHEAAALAWESMDAIRERDGVSRRMPVSEAVAGPFFSESPIQSVLDEFEFLREAVDADPVAGRFGNETSGAWRPAAARRIAWERAGEELGRVAAGLAAAP
jgi:hypothetical protein